MQPVTHIETDQSLRFDRADLEIRASLGGDSVTIDVMKSGACVHRLTISDAVGRMEHSWIANLFAREDNVALGELASEAEEYIRQLNINQG